MEIKNLQIDYISKGGFNGVPSENVKHIKVLPYFSVVQSIEGSYDISLGNGKQYQTGEGGFFIAPSNIQQTIIHHDNPKSGKMTCRWLFIDVRINKTFKLESLYQFPVVINDHRKEKLSALFNQLFATNDIWSNYSSCYELIGSLVQMAAPAKKSPNKSIQSAVEYITEHYTETLTIKDLAEISNMSESNFFAAFKKNMGSSPIAYINSYRLSIAAQKLAETDEHINEISYSVGFNDSLYFNKLFKKMYGLPPGKYRTLYQNDYTIIE